MRGVGLLTCATFAFVPVGVNWALASVVSGAAPVWAYRGVVAADMFVATCLFAVLWQHPALLSLSDASHQQ